ncbi:MAG: hypothetical protein EBU03_03575 [Methylophilaceae bacterium]|nr:hypothetical protein [Methylophilaceae bacterium]
MEVTHNVDVSGVQPAVIEQLNFTFDTDQDRLLFRVGLSDNTELSVWLTRRIAKSIWGWLQTSQSSFDEPVQVFTINAEGGLEEIQSNIISAIQANPAALAQNTSVNMDFETQYRGDRVPRLLLPLLAVASRVVTDSASQFVFELSARDGQVVNIALSLELKVAFTNLLQMAFKEAAWDIQAQSSHFVTPTVSTSQVLH